MKELVVILSSTWKFAATFPIAVYLFEMSFFETIFYTNLGGLLGIIIFTLISKGIIKILTTFWPVSLRNRKKSRKVFTKQNRWLVLIKTKYGLAGIVILTPVLLSIPVGAFLNTKYYGHKKNSYLYLFLGQVGWSVIYAIVLIKMKMVV